MKSFNRTEDNINIEQTAQTIAEIFLLQLQYEKFHKTHAIKGELLSESQISKNNLNVQLRIIKKKTS